MRGDVIAIYVTGEETEAQVINSPGPEDELAMGPGFVCFLTVQSTMLGPRGGRGLG